MRCTACQAIPYRVDDDDVNNKLNELCSVRNDTKRKK